MDLAQHLCIETRRKRRGVDRPVIRNTRMEVASIVSDAEYREMTADEIAAPRYHLTLADVHAELAKTKKDFTINGIKFTAAAKKRVTQADVAVAVRRHD